jgi:hypothetical protein
MNHDSQAGTLANYPKSVKCSAPQPNEPNQLKNKGSETLCVIFGVEGRQPTNPRRVIVKSLEPKQIFIEEGKDGPTINVRIPTKASNSLPKSIKDTKNRAPESG